MCFVADRVEAQEPAPRQLMMFGDASEAQPPEHLYSLAPWPLREATPTTDASDALLSITYPDHPRTETGQSPLPPPPPQRSAASAALVGRLQHMAPPRPPAHAAPAILMGARKSGAQSWQDAHTAPDATAQPSALATDSLAMAAVEGALSKDSSGRRGTPWGRPRQPRQPPLPASAPPDLPPDQTQAEPYNIGALRTCAPAPPATAPAPPTGKLISEKFIAIASFDADVYNEGSSFPKYLGLSKGEMVSCAANCRPDSGWIKVWKSCGVHGLVPQTYLQPVCGEREQCRWHSG